MKELKAPKKYLVKKMNNLILDNQSAEIKLLLFKKGQSIPKLYRSIKNPSSISKCNTFRF